ncbi:MAG: phosphatidylinositol dimannoside acyltransferase [Ilumatobacteraceae bacterium]
MADNQFSDFRKRLTDAATLNTYRLGSLAARLMPGPVAAGASASIGFGASFANPARRRMVERHLKRVNPRLRGAGLRVAVQQAFDYYARYYVESFRLPSMSNAAVARPFTIEGWERVLEGLDAGNGVILALPHLGGWEWAGRWMTDQGFKMTVVVEALDPPELFEWFADLRQDLGMTVVPTGPKAGPAVLRALRANETVCLLCDRDLERSGISVEFFGEHTTLPAGPATLSLRTGAALLPVGCYFTSKYNGHHAVVRPPVPTVRRGEGLRDDVTRVTQALARELEFLIRRAPEQWHLFQPNWPSDPGY